MSTKAITPDYHGEMKDSVEKFHGNQLLNIGWDRHMLFAAPICIPVPPQMPFGALVKEVLPNLYGAHPDFAKIRWDEVKWLSSGKAFVPDLAKSLAENGLVHKAVIRFRTPGLNGINGSYN